MKKPKTRTLESFCVALTGGIASGKSTASDYFKQLGVPVIDTDIISRELVKPGKPALQQISEELGAEFIHSTNQLNRKKLRKAIFANIDTKSKLEKILHPLIREEALRQSSKIDKDYYILVIPLLAKSNNYKWVDRVLVIDISEEEQIVRLIARDKISREEAKKILKAQISRTERLNLADDVLLNHGPCDHLKASVAKLHKCYIALSRFTDRKSEM